MRIIPKGPVFLPLVDDTRILETNISLPGITVEAATIKWRKPTFESLKENFSFVIIDPSTGRIPFEYSRKINFNNLPYAIKQDKINDIYSDPEFRLQKFVLPCINFQIENGASLVIPPYLYFEDTNSQAFITNIALISDTVRHLRPGTNRVPVFATINLSPNILTNKLHLGQVIGRYYGDLKDHLAGYIIQVDDLDDRHADEYTLESLAELVFQLSQSKEVIVQHIGGFSEILTLVGINAYIGGVARRERFSLKDYDDPDKDMRGRGYEWTYVPEIFNYRLDNDLEKINYVCNCDVCQGGLPSGAEESKKHFILTKTQAINILQNMDREKRAEYLKDKIINAQKLTKRLKEAETVINDQYLSRWLSIIEKIKTWEYQEDNNKIDELLSAIDKELSHDN